MPVRAAVSLVAIYLKNDYSTAAQPVQDRITSATRHIVPELALRF